MSALPTPPLPFRRRRHLLRGSLPLALLILLMVTKGVIWTAATPPFQHPDEPDHVAYADRMAHQSGVLLEHTAYSEAVQEALIRSWSPDVFHHTRTRPQNDPRFVPGVRTHVRDLSRTTPWVPSAAHEATLHSRAAGYPFLYYWGGGKVVAIANTLDQGQRDVFDDIYLLRAVSVVLSTLTVVFAYFGFGWLFASESARLLATALLALHPMFTYLGTGVNPDVLVATIAAAIFWLALRTTRGVGLSWPVSFGAATLIGIGLVTKQTAVFVGAGWALVVLAEAVRRRISFRRLALVGSMTIAIAVAIALPFYAASRNVGATNAIAGGSSGPDGALEYVKWVAEHRGASVLNEWWGVFGWLDTSMDAPVYTFLSWLTLVAAALIVFRLGVDATRRRPDAALIVLVGWVAAWALGMGYLEYQLLRSGQAPDGFVQGRYYAPLYPVLVGLLVTAYAQIVSLMRRFAGRAGVLGGRAIFAGAVPAMAALNLYALVRFILPRYHL